MKTLLLLVLLHIAFLSSKGQTQTLNYVSELFLPDEITPTPVQNFVPGTITIQMDKKRLVIANQHRSEVWKILSIKQKSEDVTEYELERTFGGITIHSIAFYDAFYLIFKFTSNASSREYAIKE